MFNRKKQSSIEKPTRIETIFGPDTTVQGTIISKGHLRIDGKVEGGISSEGVIIGETGQVQGDISAKIVIVGGQVNGNITANQGLEIQSNAQVIGDIHTAQISVAEGAVFEGNCVMSAEKSKLIEVDLKSSRV